MLSWLSTLAYKLLALWWMDSKLWPCRPHSFYSLECDWNSNLWTRNFLWLVIRKSLWLRKFCKTWKNRKILLWNEIRCLMQLLQWSLWHSYWVQLFSFFKITHKFKKSQIWLFCKFEWDYLQKHWKQDFLWKKDS